MKTWAVNGIRQVYFLNRYSACMPVCLSTRQLLKLLVNVLYCAGILLMDEHYATANVEKANESSNAFPLVNLMDFWHFLPAAFI